MFGAYYEFRVIAYQDGMFSHPSPHSILFENGGTGNSLMKYRDGWTDRHRQGCGNSDPTLGHFGLFSSLLSCFPYTSYTAQFQFTGHSLDLSDNVLHDWLFPHPWTQIRIKL